jgi:hypothetical protein
MAFAHTVFAWKASHVSERDDPVKIIEAAIQRAEDVAHLQPQDPMAQYLVGSVYRTEIVRRLHQGFDARIPMDRAIAAHEEAIRLDPGFWWPYNEVSASYGEQARTLVWRGIDPSPSVQRAIERCDQAISRDLNFTLPIISKAFAHARMAEYLLDCSSGENSPVGRAKTCDEIEDITDDVIFDKGTFGQLREKLRQTFRRSSLIASCRFPNENQIEQGVCWIFRS